MKKIGLVIIALLLVISLGVFSNTAQAQLSGAIKTKTMQALLIQSYHAPGAYQNSIWTLDKNITIVGFILENYGSVEYDDVWENNIGLTPFDIEGTGDTQAIISVGNHQTNPDGIVGFLQNTLRYEASIPNIPSDLGEFKEQVVMFPSGYGIELDSGREIYVTVYGRNTMLNPQMHFCAMAIIYYVER